MADSTTPSPPPASAVIAIIDAGETQHSAALVTSFSAPSKSGLDGAACEDGTDTGTCSGTIDGGYGALDNFVSGGRGLPAGCHHSDACSSHSNSSHSEPHFMSAEIVRDVIVGLSDGLTVPFALAAGLASLDNSRLVVTAGFAEIVAGSISMGLGGFLAGLSEIEHYKSERLREVYEVEHLPHREREEIAEIFEPYGISREAIEPLLDTLTRNKEVWVDFMMKFELNLEEPDKNRTWISALTIGTSYFFGGVVPLIPYIIITQASQALIYSAVMTIIALFIFGFVKARLLGMAHPFWSAVQMAFVGAIAAGAAFGIAKLIPTPV